MLNNIENIVMMTNKKPHQRCHFDEERGEISSKRQISPFVPQVRNDKKQVSFSE